MLIDKAKMGTYDEIKLVLKSAREYGVLFLWFADVSGSGGAEQTRRLAQPGPHKKEEDLAEHAEM